VGRLQQPSLRWATATTTKTTHSQDHWTAGLAMQAVTKGATAQTPVDQAVGPSPYQVRQTRGGTGQPL